MRIVEQAMKNIKKIYNNNAIRIDILFILLILVLATCVWFFALMITEPIDVSDAHVYLNTGFSVINERKGPPYNVDIQEPYKIEFVGIENKRFPNPLFMLTTAYGSIRLFGYPSMFTAHLMAYLFTIIGFIFTYLVLRFYLDSITALLSTMLVGNNWLLWSTYTRPLTEAPFFGLFMFCLWFLLKYPKRLFILGLLISFAYLFRQGFILMLPLFALILFKGVSVKEGLKGCAKIFAGSTATLLLFNLWFKNILLSESLTEESSKHASDIVYMTYFFNKALPEFFSISMIDLIKFVFETLMRNFYFNLFGINGFYVIASATIIILLVSYKQVKQIKIPLIFIIGVITYYLLVIVYTASYGLAAKRLFLVPYVLLAIAFIILLQELCIRWNTKPLYFLAVLLIVTLPLKDAFDTYSDLQYRSYSLSERLHEPSLKNIHEFQGIYYDKESFVSSNSALAYSTTGSRNIVHYPGKAEFIDNILLSELVDIIIIDYRVADNNCLYDNFSDLIITNEGKVFERVFVREDNKIALFVAKENQLMIRP